MRGDQLIQIQILVPRIADERSKEILKEFAQLNAADVRKDLWSAVRPPEKRV
jgi:molecular chaperone DnaJ